MQTDINGRNIFSPSIFLHVEAVICFRQTSPKVWGPLYRQKRKEVKRATHAASCAPPARVGVVDWPCK